MHNENPWDRALAPNASTPVNEARPYVDNGSILSHNNLRLERPDPFLTRAQRARQKVNAALEERPITDTIVDDVDAAFKKVPDGEFDINLPNIITVRHAPKPYEPPQARNPIKRFFRNLMPGLGAKELKPDERNLSIRQLLGNSAISSLFRETRLAMPGLVALTPTVVPKLLHPTDQQRRQELQREPWHALRKRAGNIAGKFALSTGTTIIHPGHIEPSLVSVPAKKPIDAQEADTSLTVLQIRRRRIGLRIAGATLALVGLAAANVLAADDNPNTASLRDNGKLRLEPTRAALPFSNLTNHSIFPAANLQARPEQPINSNIVSPVVSTSQESGYTGKHRAPKSTSFTVARGSNPWSSLQKLEPKASDRKLLTDVKKALVNSGKKLKQAGSILPNTKLSLKGIRLSK